jgi:single-strand DNA-binding protein
MSTFTTAGLVATEPRFLTTSEGLKIVAFRLSVPTTTTSNWFTVTAFGDLAVNVTEAVSKGDRIIVSGELNIREWDTDSKPVTVLEIVAGLVGHDLNFRASNDAE